MIRSGGPRSVKLLARGSGVATLAIRSQRSAAGIPRREHWPEPPPSLLGPLHAVAVVVTKRPWLASYVGRMLAWQSVRPTHVAVCSAAADYDIAPIAIELPDAAVAKIDASTDWSLGALRNYAMDAAARDADDDAVLCSIDDDDCYGARYLEGILDARRRHPEAIVYGRGAWEAVTVDAPPTSPVAESMQLPGGHLRGIAGATISIPAKIWRERGNLRYPDVRCGEDIEFIARARHQGAVVSSYFGDFVALRWTNASHAHTSHNAGIQAGPRRFVKP